MKKHESWLFSQIEGQKRLATASYGFCVLVWSLGASWGRGVGRRQAAEGTIARAVE